MKNNSLYTALLLCCLSMAVFSCGKDKKNATPESLLTSHAWRLKAATITPAIHNDIVGNLSDIYAEMDDCAKDDNLTFCESGEAITEDLGIRCAGSATTKVRWSLEGDAEMLFDNQPMRIVQLDKETLHLEQTISTHSPDTVIAFIYRRI